MRADGPMQIHREDPALENSQHQVTLVTNGDIAQMTFDLLEQAQKEIISMEFLLRDDDFGMMKLAVLRRKAREGKKVLVHVDSFHLLVNPALVFHLTQEGIEFSVFNLMTLKNAFKFSYRNHCKFLIIDGRVFKTGDTNSGNEYVHWQSPQQMKSMDVVISGSLASKARTYALEVLKSPLSTLPQFKLASKDRVLAQRKRIHWASQAMKTFLKAIQVETDGPDQITKPDCILITQEEAEAAQRTLDFVEEKYLNRNLQPLSEWSRQTLTVSDVRFHCDSVEQKGEYSRVSEAISGFLATARKKLVIVSPYLILTPKMKRAIHKALGNGASVSFYTNSATSTDNKTTQLAYEYRLEEISTSGPLEIYEYEGPETLHAKFILKDDQDCMLMTYNIDWRSEIKNLETAFEFQNRDLKNQLDQWLQNHKQKFKLVAKERKLLKPLPGPTGHEFWKRMIISSLERHL